MNKSSLTENRFAHAFFRALPVLLIIPALLPLILIIALPAIKTLSMSFHRITYGLPEEYTGLDNYRTMFQDSLFRLALRNTVIFSFSVVAGEVLVGLTAAVVLSTGFPGQKLWISILMVPYAVTDVVAIIVWKYMLDPDVGIINYLLNTVLGIAQIEWASHPVQAWMVIILLRVWMNFPFSFLIIYSSLIGIPRELYESVFIDGATNWQGFRFITIPLAAPAIMVATIFSFIFAFRNFATVWILTGGGPMNKTELLSILLYRQAFSYWEFGAASAVAITMTVITFIIAIYYLRSMYKEMFLKASG